MRQALGAKTTDDPLAAARDRFPLGRSFNDPPLRAAGTRPLGATLAVKPRCAEEVDMAVVSYDPDRQIAVVREADGRFAEVARHSTGWTNTNTASSDKRPGDSDRDATED